ncbi:FERM and PDZ domain-containing protein 2-like [Hyaena hyaena]|uniref:FERM and PDZ domain-containing protein 2-like n=1 Tax=Hyaena hyaena TaxID=95912 RepID=UPI001923A8E8|nr:FERM and PDZ domain-containing protein 2-like [Hyaena hyaena]
MTAAAVPNAALVHTCIRVEFTPLLVTLGIALSPSQGHLLVMIPQLALQTVVILCTPIMALVSDSSDYVVCPWSALLSAAGSLSFQDHISHIEAAPFKAPELLQGQSDGEQPDASQPLQLREPLHSILLTMCEDQPCRRLPLQSVLEACRVHREEVAVYPTSANLHVRRLAGLVLGTISEVERRIVEESSSVQQDRSCLLRNRLHQASCENAAVWALERLHPCRVSERSTETQSSLEPGQSTSAHSHRSLSVSSALPTEGSPHLQEGQQLSSSTTLSVAAEISHPATPSRRGFPQRKGKVSKRRPKDVLQSALSRDLCVDDTVVENGQGPLGFSRPEFILLAAEAPVTVHLPGSIVTKKGKSYLALRALCVVLLSGQCLEVKCDIMSTAGAVFSAVTSFVNLGELTYFGLAYMKDKEFFFLDNETRLCKIAPEGWSEQPQKTSSNTFTLFLRIKFFVSCCAQLQNSQTRHQFYLQLRKDILEEKLYCNDETLLQLAVLALQAECGNYPEEVETKAYFRVEDYIPASLIERLTAFRVQVEVSEMHRLSPVLWGEDAELEFLRNLVGLMQSPSLIDPQDSDQIQSPDLVTQQLPEYGVLVHRVLPEKTRREGDMALGICAKGVIVYEVKNNSRIATLRFQWREIGKISTCRKKFTITSGVTGKKHTFVTDSAKTCKYLLGLCSAQHGFNAQMSFLPAAAVPDDDKCVQMANMSLAHLAPSQPLTWIQRLSGSENALFAPAPGLGAAAGGLRRMSLDNFTVETSKETAARGIRGSPCTGREQLETICLIQKSTTYDPLSGPPVPSVHREPQSNRRKNFIPEPEREIVHVTLRREPRRGFGFVINEGEDVGRVAPGIFISSIIPGGPAEKAKKIKPGGQILALNHISLEGFTFDMAVRMIQNSPDNIELTIAQSKGICGNTPSEEKNSPANSGVFSTDSPSNGHQESFASHAQKREKNTEELEMAQTQSLLPLMGQAAGSSCPPSASEINASEIYFVELVKEDGTLGFSVTGGINTSVPYGGIYVKSIVPGGPAAKEGQILRDLSDLL